ncbi:putative ABC transporter ATP-binding protein [Sulfitobacter sp. THAF37]|uniref:ABC transporter transmembrane domain-containing protein n=1 Tax=Sulfitobacter sp. THAF37 TaxID=2587855 RepID=UPI0012A9DA88|nr:ABC transporter transmembrane domain-containing protein [Sulfitobacter sp. THAF37]QFT59058.1 putative ABC transporter ATP-binding protein [Sulfitobacter sp. THAF37]
MPAAWSCLSYSKWNFPIERSLFSFIWKYSKRDQLILLLVTLTLFPLLYLTLELPKRIINDAIGAESGQVDVWGYEVGQITFLMILCGLFLLSVLLHGVMKMRINTMKGVLSERLLRRLRYTLIARILRFPAPYFERTSQGELVSMVTSEAEPMGGLMGDAVAQPVLQAGQMLTILVFLFLQSVAFGLAACALIPLQAWLIPRLQRRINLLNKSRVIEVRALAAEIGESAAGASTLRTHGGWRYRLALISDRLGRLYAIRFEIFQKKFFMKFLNNFIGQLTPFFFYSIGGYLAITGDITVGALVAALAAYKDLASPWKELLAYYNQSQDMAVRWETVTERFAPAGMIDARLFEGHPDDLPSLAGDVELKGVSVEDGDGNAVLDGITATFPKGSTVAISAASDEDRQALAALLTREVMPVSGSVVVAGHALDQLHQATIAARIGHASSAPVLFQGNLGDNINMALRRAPRAAEEGSQALESLRTGNSPDPVAADWLDIAPAGAATPDELGAWWMRLVRGMGIEDALLRRAMDLRLDSGRHKALAAALVDLRAPLARRLAAEDLSAQVSVFDPASYTPTLAVAENLLFATPREPVTADLLARQSDFMTLLDQLDLETDLLNLAVDLVDLLRQTFGHDGTDHPLFRKLGLDAQTYGAALDLLPRHRRGDPLNQDQKAQLLAVPFVIPAEKIGTAFPQDVIDRVLDMRAQHGAALRDSMAGVFQPLDGAAPIQGMTVLENALFGKLHETTDSEAVQNLVMAQLREAELDSAVLRLLFDLPLSLGGANLSAQLGEPSALSRAAIKRPDILVLDNVLASYGPDQRRGLHDRLRALLPETTIICLAPEFDDAEEFDRQFVVRQGRLSSVADAMEDSADQTVSADLSRKLRALERTDLFAGLARKQLRLLAFGARWHETSAGEYVFRKGDVPDDGAYLILSGEADLLLPQEDGEDRLITTSGPGALVGELGLIRNVPRALDMRAASDLTCLRIGAEEFLAVVENDASTAYKILQVVASYV